MRGSKIWKIVRSTALIFTHKFDTWQAIGCFNVRAKCRLMKSIIYFAIFGSSSPTYKFTKFGLTGRKNIKKKHVRYSAKKCFMHHSWHVKNICKSNTAHTARRWTQKCNNHLIGTWRNKTLQKNRTPTMTRLWQKKNDFPSGHTYGHAPCHFIDFFLFFFPHAFGRYINDQGKFLRFHWQRISETSPIPFGTINGCVLRKKSKQCHAINQQWDSDIGI